MKTLRIVTLAVAASLAGSMLGSPPGHAASNSFVRAPAKMAATSPVRPVAAVEAEEDEGVGCSKLRKRLWVESEGWVVRKVSICR